MGRLKSYLVFMWVIAICLVFISYGCTPPPTQELADAEAALSEAREAGAERLAAQEYESAESKLEEARMMNESRDYLQAKELAIEARDTALLAKSIADEAKIKLREQARETLNAARQTLIGAEMAEAERYDPEDYHSLEALFGEADTSYRAEEYHMSIHKAEEVTKRARRLELAAKRAAQLEKEEEKEFEGEGIEEELDHSRVELKKAEKELEKHRPAYEKKIILEKPKKNNQEVIDRHSYSTDIVDEIVGKLQWGNIVFNVPQKMQFHSPEQIELLLSLKKTFQELQTDLNCHPLIEFDRVQISNRMEARLSGKGFKIEALVPEIQAVSSEKTTKWKWEVIPTDYGVQRLHLTLTAKFNISDEESPYVIRTFDKNIEVEITLGQHIAGFILNNWQWLWVAVLVPIITFFGKFLAKTKRN